MPQRDAFHSTVRTALERDGWTITDDPLVLAIGRHNLFVDLGAERLLGAERGHERIAVEVKGFVGRSEVADLEQALGQYVLYRGLLRRSDPARELLLALPKAVYESLLTSELGRVARDEIALAMMVFDPEAEVIWQWFR
jgi:hypothetical protein